MSGEHVIRFYRDEADELRVQVDAPGERAVSAPAGEWIDFLRSFCQGADLELDASMFPDEVTIRVPAGS